MPEAFFNDRDLVTLGSDWLERLKEAAATAPFRRARYCLHRSTDDAIQEMLIVYCRDSLVRPHRHQDKSESYHVISGEAQVLIFNDDGTVKERIHMGPPGSGLPFSARLDAPLWHCTVPITDFFTVVEVTSGPFDKAQSEKDMAPWAPAEPDALRAFLEAASTA